MILINFHKNKTHAAIDNVRLMEIDKAVRRLRTISLDFRLTVELVFIYGKSCHANDDVHNCLWLLRCEDVDIV